MNILELLAGAGGQGGGDAVGAIAANLGLDKNQTRAVMEKLVPVLGAGLKKNAASADGQASLLRALQGGNHAQYLRDPARLASGTGIDEGNAILGHILGNKDASRSVASAAAERTGVDYSMVKKMLPMVAAAVMGAMSQQKETISAANPATGQMDVSSLLGSFLDTDRDGSIADDLLGAASKLFRG